MRSLKLSDRNKLPKAPGIYWLIHNGRVIYVGLAVNLRQRWTGDRHDQYAYAIALPGVVRLRYRRVPRQLLRYQEAIDIQKYKPHRNKQIPKPKKHYYPFAFLHDCFIFLVTFFVLAAVFIFVL